MIELIKRNDETSGEKDRPKKKTMVRRKRGESGRPFTLLFFYVESMIKHVIVSTDIYA